MGQDHGDYAIMLATVTIAHAFGLEVVAEGVETEEQLAKLRALECNFAQGYYFWEPLPPKH